MNLPNIRKVREENNLKQDEIATSLNVARKTVTGWENQHNIIPLSKLIEFANIYEVSMDYIFGLTKTNNYKHIELNKKIIGNNLLRLRIKNKRTQHYISKKLNISNGTYCDYEKGHNLIRTIYITALLKIYDKFSIDDLFK